MPQNAIKTKKTYKILSAHVSKDLSSFENIDSAFLIIFAMISPQRYFYV